MSDIKNCPCCHGKCEVRNTLQFAEKYSNTWADHPYFVECSICHTRSSFFDTEEYAIANWNIRNEHRHKPIAGCPLCKEGSGRLKDIYHPLYQKRMYHVSCSECGFMSGWFATADKAIDSWNGVKHDD